MSPLASYRRLFTLAGPLYVVVAFVGRLPLAMAQMGTLLLVPAPPAPTPPAAPRPAPSPSRTPWAHRSPAASPTASASDPVVLVQSVLGGLGLLALVALAQARVDPALVVAMAAVAGAAMPQIGPLARVRWRPITRKEEHHQPHLMEAAFSYEGAADEASFVLGPALLGLIVVVASPQLALVVAAGILLVFGCAFALHPTARLTHAHRAAAVTGARLVTATFVVLLVAQLLIGVVFGSIQTGTTVLATDAGQAGIAGLVHASLGVGSVIAGLAVASLPARFGYAARVLVAALGLALLSLPLLVTDTIPRLFVVVLVLGLRGRAVHDQRLHARRAGGPGLAGRRGDDAARRRDRHRVRRGVGRRRAARRRARPHRRLRGHGDGSGIRRRAGGRCRNRCCAASAGRTGRRRPTGGSRPAVALSGGRQGQFAGSGRSRRVRAEYGPDSAKCS